MTKKIERWERKTWLKEASLNHIIKICEKVEKTLVPTLEKNDSVVNYVLSKLRSIERIARKRESDPIDPIENIILDCTLLHGYLNGIEVAQRMLKLDMSYNRQDVGELNSYLSQILDTAGLGLPEMVSILPEKEGREIK